MVWSRARVGRNMVDTVASLKIEQGTPMLKVGGWQSAALLQLPVMRRLKRKPRK